MLLALTGLLDGCGAGKIQYLPLSEVTPLQRPSIRRGNPRRSGSPYLVDPCDGHQYEDANTKYWISQVIGVRRFEANQPRLADATLQ